MKELYVVAYVNKEGEVTGFPKGGGSSSPSYIRAFEKSEGAQRSMKRLNFTKVANIEVVKVNGFEVVE